MGGDADGYLRGCHANIKGAVMGGLLPGGENVQSKDELTKLLKEDIPKYMDIRKFEPLDWAAEGDNVYFVVNWEFLWKPTNKLVKTQGKVHKVVRDNLICEKYHMVNAPLIMHNMYGNQHPQAI